MHAGPLRPTAPQPSPASLLPPSGPGRLLWPPSCARHFMMSLLVSVLPAPDSPVICRRTHASTSWGML
eukprot:361365-Chlamydomonas_euryale.AAC.8